jgi:autotransporter-associated beta strand protein
MELGTASSTSSRVVWMHRACLFVALGAGLLFGPRVAEAQSVWTATTTGGTAAWSSSANWLGGSVPTSGTGTTLQFFTDTTTPLSSGTITADNDLGPFTLGSLVLNGLSPATAATTTVRLTGGNLTFNGPAPAIALNGVSTTGTLSYDIANNITFNANTSISGAGSANFTLSGVLSGAATITKTGASTLQLNGDSSSTFSGGLVIGGGGVTVNGGLGGKLASNQSIVFTGVGSFTYASNGLSTTGTVGTVEFRAGSGAVSHSRGTVGSASLVVSSVAVAQGATGRFSHGVGSLGSNTQVRIANQAVGYLPASISYSTGPAYYTTGSGTAGYVGSVNYGTTPNSVALTGTQTTLGANTGKHVQYTATSATSQLLTGTIGATQVTVVTPANFSVGGIVSVGVPAFTYVTAISGSTLTLSKGLTSNNPSSRSFTGVSAQTTDSIASLRFANGNGGSILLGASQTLTISSGGIYATGNNDQSGQLIAGGSGITTGGTTSLYYWSDSANGGLSIQTPILATTTGGVVVTGANAPFELAAANTFTGGVWLNSGNTRVAFAETPGTSGPLGASGTIWFNGGTLQYSSANTFDYSSRFSTAAGQLYSVNTNSQNATWAANLTSAGGTLTKAASGNLTLTGSNAFAGVSVNSGLVIIGNANALGTGTVTLNGGGLSADGSPRTVTNPVVFAASATLQSGSSAAALTLAGPVSLPSSAITISVPTNVTNTPDISGSISGSNTALSLGNGTNLILSGNNSGWTPASFAVDNGGITVGHSNALGSGSATYTTANGGALGVNADLTGSNARANNFVLGGALTISGSQGLTVLGSVTASAANRTLTNNIQSDRLVTLAGPVLLRNGTDTTARVVTFAGTGNTTISGTIANGGVSGSASLLKTGTGILRITAANTYTGTTGITGGIVAIGGTNSLPGWSTTGRYSVATGAAVAVQSGVQDGSVTTILGTGNFAANASIGFDTTDGNRTYAGSAIANTGAGTLGFVKIGSGTLTMSAANTYTGTTQVLEGTMRLGVANALPSASPVTLTGGGSLDVANSTSSGTVTMSGAGAIIGSATLTGSAYVFSNTSGTATVSAILGGSGATLSKSNDGTLVLSSANTFAGKTSVTGGTLEFASIGNVGGGASALGAPTTTANGTIDVGSGATVATLRYAGSGTSSSNRTINLAGSAGGGATIEAAGSGPLVLTGSVSAATGSKTLTLTGTSIAANAIAFIANSSTGSLSVVKDGSGWWRLTGTSGFDGTFTVKNGTLVAAVNGGAINNSGAFGTGGAPVVGDTAAGATGAATLLAEAGVEIRGGVTVSAAGAGSTQAVRIGGINSSGTATYLANTDFKLGRDVTLVATGGGVAKFDSNWWDASGTGTPAVNVTIGAADYQGIVRLSKTGTLATTGSVAVRYGTALIPSTSTTLDGAGTLSIDSGATLGGIGTVAAPLGGAGLVAPGNSPGILTAEAFDASGGLDVAFEFTGLTPTYSGTANVNDILRLTGASPFVSGSLSAANVVSLYLPANAASGGVFTGGFFTDVSSSSFSTFLSSVTSGSFVAYYLDSSGTVAYGGNMYSLLANQVQVGTTTVSGTTTFATGGSAVDGQVTTFTVVVPEPASIALAVIGVAMAGYAVRRRRR